MTGPLSRLGKVSSLIGKGLAGTLIYLKAGATKVPDWYATDADALADLRERAGAAT